MPRLALALAFGALVASALPSPGLFLALGLGIAAVGTGWVGFRDSGASGFARLGATAAITLGGIGLVLGGLRVVLVLAAIGHLERLVG